MGGYLYGFGFNQRRKDKPKIDFAKIEEEERGLSDRLKRVIDNSPSEYARMTAMRELGRLHARQVKRLRFAGQVVAHKEKKQLDERYWHKRRKHDMKQEGAKDEAGKWKRNELEARLLGTRKKVE